MSCLIKIFRIICKTDIKLGTPKKIMTPIDYEVSRSYMYITRFNMFCCPFNILKSFCLLLNIFLNNWPFAVSVLICLQNISVCRDSEIEKKFKNQKEELADITNQNDALMKTNQELSKLRIEREINIRQLQDEKESLLTQ